MKAFTLALAGCHGITALASQTPLRDATDETTGNASPYLFANPPDHDAAARRIPTSYESAVLARRILALTPLATIATVFPPDNKSSSDTHGAENRPAGLGGAPLGLMEYIADCESDIAGQSGNPTILAITIASSFKNIAAGSNVSLSLQWTPRYAPDERIKSRNARKLSWLSGLLRGLGLGASHDEDALSYVPYSAANLPRFSLHGYVEPIPGGDDRSSGTTGAKLASCFVDTHPDARYWLPGSPVHESHFVRLVVTHVYWIGGFGDRAYIGWIPIEQWRNVTRKEWEAVRLPGEKKGWKEWSIQGDADEL